MSLVIVELAESDIKDAVIAWAKKNFSENITPQDVEISIKKEWRGIGPTEHQVSKPTIRYKRTT